MSDHPKAEAEVVQELTEAATVLNKVIPDNSTSEIALVPKSTDLVSLDQFRDMPKRIKENILFSSLKSFCDYVVKFQNDNSIIVANSGDRKLFTAHIDYHGKGEPSWDEHKCIFSITHTDAWLTLSQFDNLAMNQRDFMNFINDNAELIKKPDLADLIAEIQAVEVKQDAGSTSNVSHNSENFERRGNYEITSLKTELIEFVVSPARFADTYAIKARLFCAIDESGHRPQVTFKYSLVNSDRLIEIMTDKFVEIVTDKTQITPFS
jgi:uncharacterized protein YfdQ (DUF2303 family)